MKKLLLIATLGLFIAINAMAQDGIPYNGTCGENLIWEFDAENSVLTISGTGDMMDYYDVGAVPWSFFSHLYSIEHVDITDGVTRDRKSVV